MKVLLPGQYIKHGVYGLGTIKESDTERTTIDFDDHGLKKFVTSMMICELLGDAPPRPSRSKHRKKAVPASAEKVPPVAKEL